MRYFPAILFILLPFSVIGQNMDYVLFESILLKPPPGKTLAMIEKINDHNSIFHKEGAQKAYLFELLTGPRSGYLMWEMGPMTYHDLDKSMPEGHRMHWEENVASMAQKIDKIQYWLRRDDVGYNPAGEVVADKILARLISLKPHGSMEAVLDAMRKISRTMEYMSSIQARRVYVSEFRSDDREDIMIVYPFTNWTQFEESKGLPKGWQKAFEDLYGPGSLQTMITKVMEENTTGRYDQIMINVGR